MLVVAVLWAGGSRAMAVQAVALDGPGAALPDAPDSQIPSSSATPKADPCARTAEDEGAPPKPGAAMSVLGTEGGGVYPAATPCRKKPPNAYQRFADGPRDALLTPRDKAWLAARNVVDPFNLVTILGEAGISVGFDSHSPYGPGMTGYGRYVGVSFTQDLTGEFFGTFAIPALTHQDPRYHRMGGKLIRRRVFHAATQVVWTQSDYGRGMPNYANLVGFAIDDEISNLYVPGRQTDAGATAERYAIGLATAPVGNFVDEFLPDVASHIHVQIVILQRIINRVARTASQGGTESGEDGSF